MNYYIVGSRCNWCLYVWRLFAVVVVVAAAHEGHDLVVVAAAAAAALMRIIYQPGRACSLALLDRFVRGQIAEKIQQQQQHIILLKEEK